jgi:hypothetical protein
LPYARKGVEWKPVKAKSLSKANQELYKQYADAFQAASVLASKLKQAVTIEWENKFPEGVNGQDCSFNAIGVSCSMP